METFVALLLFLFPLAYSPGPGNIFFAANGARYGVRATLPANFGYHVATIIVAVVIGSGFAAIMDQFPRLFDVIRVLGAAYVLYLAVTFLRAPSGDHDSDGNPVGFVSGAALLILNPKAYLIMTLMGPCSVDCGDIYPEQLCRVPDLDGPWRTDRCAVSECQNGTDFEHRFWVNLGRCGGLDGVGLNAKSAP